MPGAFDHKKPDVGAFASADPLRLNEVPVERGFLAPLATYADGKTELAMPGFPLGMIWDGMRSFGAKGFDTPEANELNVKAATDAAGGAMTGSLAYGLAGGMVDNALGSAGGKLTKAASDLPMDLASRMGRAREMGFDTETPLYHGTPKPGFDEFTPSTQGKLGPGVYASPDPKLASRWAGDSGAVMPLMARGKFATSPDEVTPFLDQARQIMKDNGHVFGSAIDLARTNEWKATAQRLMQEAGYAGNKVSNEVVVFDPSDLRSINAAFDPSKSDSANLLAANAKSGASVPLAIDAAERTQPQIRQTHPNIFEASLDGKEAGQFYVKSLPNAAVVKEAFVRPEFQGQGVGKAAYGAIQDALGVPLTPDSQLTAAGYNFWKSAYPEAVREHRLMNNGAYEAAIPEGEIPSWRMAGGPNRPNGVAWSNAPTGAAIPAGMQASQDQDLKTKLQELK